MKRALFMLPIGLGALGMVHAADGKPYSEHVPASPSGTVQVKNVSGSVTVSGWDKAEVDIQGELGPTVDHVEVTHTADQIEIKVILPHDLQFDAAHGADAKLQIHVPAGSAVEVSTVSAPITLEGIHGSSRLRSVNADIHADAPGAAEDVSSVNGNVYLSGNATVKSLRASTVNGKLVLTHGYGDLNARTVNGELDLAVDAAKSVDIGSVSGPIDFQGHLARDATLRGSTVDGKLSVKVSAEAGYKYDLASFSGSLHSCFDTQSVKSAPGGTGSKATGTTGEGNATVSLRTLRGALDLCDK